MCTWIWTFFHQNLTDLSYLTAFFCIVNLSHCKREKKQVSDYFGRNNVHFPKIILCVCVCPWGSVWVRVCLSDIWLFWCNKVCLLYKKMIPDYWNILFLFVILCRLHCIWIPSIKKLESVLFYREFIIFPVFFFLNCTFPLQKPGLT